MAIGKDQKQMIIVGVLVVVLILVFMNNLKPRKKKQAPASPAAPAAAAKPPAGQPAAAVPSREDGGKTEAGQKERAESLNWGRDPFLPYEEQKIETTEFSLQGVSIGKGKKGYALINNEIVKTGDTFMGHRVLEIEKDKVLLEKDGQSFYIVFPQEE